MFIQNFIIYLVAVSCAMAASTKRSPDDLPIKYPGPTTVVDMNRYSKPGDDQVPDPCRGQNYCHIKPKDYPQEAFNKLFENITATLPQPELLPDSLSNRQGDLDDKDDCISVIEFKPIYQVRDKRDDKWRMVVNVEEKKFIQKVRLEKCTKIDAPCFVGFPTFPGTTTHCKQKFSHWEVLVEGRDGGTETIVTELPVCCSCHYRTLDLEDRFGKPKSKEEN